MQRVRGGLLAAASAAGYIEGMKSSPRIWF